MMQNYQVQKAVDLYKRGEYVMTAWHDVTDPTEDLLEAVTQLEQLRYNSDNGTKATFRLTQIIVDNIIVEPRIKGQEAH